MAGVGAELEKLFWHQKTCHPTNLRQKKLKPPTMYRYKESYLPNPKSERTKIKGKEEED